MKKSSEEKIDITDVKNDKDAKNSKTGKNKKETNGKQDVKRDNENMNKKNSPIGSFAKKNIENKKSPTKVEETKEIEEKKVNGSAEKKKENLKKLLLMTQCPRFHRNLHKAKREEETKMKT